MHTYLYQFRLSSLHCQRVIGVTTVGTGGENVPIVYPQCLGHECSLLNIKWPFATISTLSLTQLTCAQITHLSESNHITESTCKSYKSAAHLHKNVVSFLPLFPHTPALREQIPAQHAPTPTHFILYLTRQQKIHSYNWNDFLITYSDFNSVSLMLCIWFYCILMFPFSDFPFVVYSVFCTLSWPAAARACLSIKQNQISVHPKVDHRTGQLCLPHIGITKTEKNRTKT